MKSLFFLLLVLGFSFETYSSCELKLQKHVQFDTEELTAGPLFKFADDTIYFNRQNTGEYIFMKPDGSYKTYIPPQHLITEPTLLRNGNLLFSSVKGELLELNSNAEVVRSVYIAPKYTFDAVLEWDSETWFLTKTDGRILKSSPFETQTKEIFDLNAGNPSSDPYDRDTFFRGAVNYQNTHLIINPVYASGITFLNQEGKKVFQERKVYQTSFQDPLILDDGTVLVWGLSKENQKGLITSINPHQDFKQDFITFDNNQNPHFVMKTSDGFAVGFVSINPSRTHYDQHLVFFNSSWQKMSEILTSNAGFDVYWKPVQLTDGHIVNGVDNTVQLISPQREVIAKFRLPDLANGQTQSVNGSPVILSNGNMVYLGNSTDVFILNKTCSK